MRRRGIGLAMAVLLLTSALVVPVAAYDLVQLHPQTAQPAALSLDSGMIDESSNLWFVELFSAPASEGTDKRRLKSERDTFRKDAKAVGVRYTERMSFESLFNGFSVQAAPTEMGKLSRLSGVKAVYPVVMVDRPASLGTSSPELSSALAMTGADIAQSEMGLTGTGIRVAVMDTGIDYHHPDLGGCFGPGCRVAVGYDFVGDAFNANPNDASYNPIPAPDNDPDDCNGHGTHVAGIVGANGAVMGVAPGVTFGAYRVFGCAGSTTADIMLAAMERALDDKMHVLNMSIGSAFQWPKYPTALAASRLVNKGMVVVASIGNSGASGLYSAGAPGLGENVIGVASFENTNIALAQFTVSPDDQPIGYSPAAGAPTAPTSGSAPMARTGTVTSPDDACNPLAAGSLTGKVALIRRGACTFHLKALHAQSAGAIGVVLYNNIAGPFSPTVAGSPAITIPVVAIADTAGQLINNRLAVGPVTMTWTATLGLSVNPVGGTISSFSSYGLSPDLEIKPDIGAPGGMIYSTYPLEQGGYATISGTSMSSPHVAGAVALLLEAHPRTPAKSVRGILQNTASPRNWWGNPGLGFLDNVNRQGAGMLQIDAAIRSQVRVEPSKLSLGESQGGPATRSLKIENRSSNPVTYTLSHVPALSNGPNTFTPSFFTGFATMTMSATEVTVPAGESSSVSVTVEANQFLSDNRQYGGYLVLTPTGGGDRLVVPYAGFKGDYQSIQALAPASVGLPWLARIVGNSYFKEDAGAVYSMQGDDIPMVLLHLSHQVRRLRIEVRDANTGRNWHRAVDFEYMGRNSGPTAFFALPFDGTTVTGKRLHLVPDGTYVLEVSVLKALGDDNNPAHWETWTSPSFAIDRP